MFALEERVKAQAKIFSVGKRRQILKDECGRDDVTFYAPLTASATRWASPRYHSYKNSLNTLPQQIDLLLVDRLPKRDSEEKT